MLVLDEDYVWQKYSRTQADWLNMEVVPVNNEECFFSLLQECGPEGFYHNRTTLLKAYVNKNLYTIGGIPENSDDPKWSQYYDFPAAYRSEDGWTRMQILPCFCVVNGTTCEILWVHERIRKKGFATMMLEALEVNAVNQPLPESKIFWKKYLERIAY